MWALAVGSYQEIGAEDIAFAWRLGTIACFVFINIVQAAVLSRFSKRDDGWHVYLECSILMALINYLLIHNSNDFSHYSIPLLVPS